MGNHPAIWNLSGPGSPLDTETDAPIGTLFVSNDAGKLWIKNGVTDADWVEVGSGGGAATPSALPEQWAQSLVTASQTDVELSAQVSTNFDRIVAPASGSVRTLVIRTDAVLSAGSLTVKIAVNGAAGALQASLTTGQQTVTITQAEAIDTFVAGDTISALVTTDGSFAPAATLNLEVWIGVSY